MVLVVFLSWNHFVVSTNDDCVKTWFEQNAWMKMTCMLEYLSTAQDDRFQYNHWIGRQSGERITFQPMSLPPRSAVGDSALCGNDPIFNYFGNRYFWPVVVNETSALASRRWNLKYLNHKQSEIGLCSFYRWRKRSNHFRNMNNYAGPYVAPSKTFDTSRGIVRWFGFYSLNRT